MLILSYLGTVELGALVIWRSHTIDHWFCLQHYFLQPSKALNIDVKQAIPCAINSPCSLNHSCSNIWVGESRAVGSSTRIWLRRWHAGRETCSLIPRTSKWAITPSSASNLTKRYELDAENMSVTWTTDPRYEGRQTEPLSRLWASERR